MSLKSGESSEPVEFRRALAEDAPELRLLVEASIRGIGSRYYSPRQVESSLVHLFGVDSTMIADSTYSVATTSNQIIGAGGWSFRKTPFGGDQATDIRNAEIRVPGVDPAIIRAMYVHPDWARMKIGQMILTMCEFAARRAGFERLELVATLSGLQFYEKQGYKRQEKVDIPLPDGVVIEAYKMAK